MPASETGTPEPNAPGATTDASIGKAVDGRYRIEAQLGSGGMGRVYRARHLALDRLVALKLLRKHHRERWVSRKRFEREARSLAQLSHPHIVAVTDCGMDGDVPFLVMELLPGESLEARLRAGPIPPAAACALMQQLLSGLAFVHGQGLVHRDIKPANIFLARSESGGDQVKLLDFGLAKLVVPSTDVNITRAGETSGTPAYMAPEQITGEESDCRTDVYAAGLVLFEMIAGRRPFSGTEYELLRQQVCEPLPALSALRPEARALDAVLERATHKERSRRFADASAMAAALATATSRRAEPAPHRTAAPRPAAARPVTLRPARSRAAEGSWLRTGALLLCGVAMAAILALGGVIYMLDSPQGAERRVLLQRAFSSVLKSEGTERRPTPPPRR
jgi:eukaryotic-like serine/threonine-protein kinase